LKLLLDTHAALWWLADDARVSDRAAEAVVDDRNQVFLSAVVVWEVAIKRSLGKLEAPADIAEALVGAGAQPLPVALSHAAAVERLPWHHRDPFDRLLIAQALDESASIVTADERLAAYEVQLVW
jgi:PIN domain nuclease of toxin-antitoxin system